MHKPIHLLYSPTTFCNMGCSYCYLGTETNNSVSKEDQSLIQQTLITALENLSDTGYIPFNVSLHGGEVTTLPEDTLRGLFQIIKKHYIQNFDNLNSLGIKKNKPHVKTNLYNFDQLFDLFSEHEVSVSASIDLPLSFHDKHRTLKNGNSTLDKILENLKLLSRYPHRKKASAVLYNDHLENVDQLIEDIWYIHNEIGFNMNNFNFMFGFESKLNEEKFADNLKLDVTSVSDNLQVSFYNRLKDEFSNTELEEGFKGNWFDEFKPTYCTNSVNCGEKFYLLQSDGSMYSCVRGQGSDEFAFGNIFSEPFDIIAKRAKAKINTVHQKQNLHDDCLKCEYLYLCNTGCPFIKFQKETGKSYTCALQKEIYKDNPVSYPIPEEKQRVFYQNKYIKDVHPGRYKEIEPSIKPDFIIPNDFHEEKNEFLKIIESDHVLQHIYSNNLIKILIDGETHLLESPIIKNERTIHFVNKDSELKVLLHSSIFEANCNDLIRNTFHIQLLRDTKVVYGDEKREKQEHIFTHQLFYNVLQKQKEYFEYDLMGLLKLNEMHFHKNVINNVFFTTNSLREYHYKKQKSNAFYHIQAINLPFPNFEFYWGD